MNNLKLLAGKKQKNENNRRVAACNDYLRMGPGRSIRKLHRKYRSMRDEGEVLPPTARLTTIEQWCSRFKWVERAEEYDQIMEEDRQDYVRRVMNSGLAQEHERVALLNQLAETLIGEIFEEGDDGVLHNLWLPDVKQIGSGKNITRVDIEKYNSSIVDNLRGVLDDLAKETGGRVQKKDVTSKGDKISVTFTGNIDHDAI